MAPRTRVPQRARALQDDPGPAGGASPGASRPRMAGAMARRLSSAPRSAGAASLAHRSHWTAWLRVSASATSATRSPRTSSSCLRSGIPPVPCIEGTRASVRASRPDSAARRGGLGIGRCLKRRHRKARTLSALRRAVRRTSRQWVGRIRAGKRTVAPARSGWAASARDPDSTMSAVPGPGQRSRMIRLRFTSPRRTAIRAASGVDSFSMSASCR